jgi:phage-related protein
MNLKMVGIYAKIKNGFIKPVVNTVNKIVHNPFVNNLVKTAAPALNSFIPGLGTGISTGFEIVKNITPVAQQLISDGEKGGIQNVFQNFTQGNYNKDIPKQLQRVIQSGMGLAKRPDTLHNRLQLRASPAPEMMNTAPFKNPRVEELD